MSKSVVTFSHNTFAGANAPLAPCCSECSLSVQHVDSPVTMLQVDLIYLIVTYGYVQPTYASLHHILYLNIAGALFCMYIPLVL